MVLQTELFGRLADGTAVERVRLRSGKLEADILGLGATLCSLRVYDRQVVLQLSSLAEYAFERAFFGAIVGRFANRIAKGRFTLDGVEYQLPVNEFNRTHLHGGVRGFAHRLWRIETVEPASVALRYMAADGEEGYPGVLEVRCTYAIVAEATLRITLTAETSHPTIVNLVAHSYFNLDGGGSTADQILEIPAERYLPVDADKIPTGECASVAGTAYDFRMPRRIDDFEYDNAFILAETESGAPRLAARLTAMRSGIEMEIHSTEPAVQFYDGHKISLGGFKPREGLCLEPQRFPDAPNHPDFPSTVLRPGEVYRQITEYRFRQL